jgi:hypothetical protein
MQTKSCLCQHIAFACVTGLAVLLGGCAGPKPAADTQAANSTIPNTPASDVKATATAPASATPLPAEPSATPTPEVLHPDGPYLLFEGQDGVWLANPDGSALTRISGEGIGRGEAHGALSPDGTTLAYITTNPEGLALKLLSLPDGNLRTVAQILQLTEDEKFDYSPGSKGFVYMAIDRYTNLAWRPQGGDQLAFIGAMDGPSADLYLYDLDSELITRLSSGASQAIAPSWSPDGSYLLHFGVNWLPPFGGAIVGYNRFDGTWAVRVSDGTITSMPRPYDTHFHFLGWMDETHYIVNRATERCSRDGLYVIDVTTGRMAPLLEGCLGSGAALSPGKAILYTPLTGCTGCPEESGIFLLPMGSQQAQQISEQEAYQFSWMEGEGLFYAYPVGLFSEEGARAILPPVPGSSFNPAISRSGYAAWEVIENQLGRVMAAAPGEAYRVILEDLSIGVLIWDPFAGDTLFVASVDGTFYRAKAPEFVPEQIGNFGGWVSQAIWLP